LVVKPFSIIIKRLYYKKTSLEDCGTKETIKNIHKSRYKTKWTQDSYLYVYSYSN